jgi:Carboxypeptidase regulatory-like domain
MRRVSVRAATQTRLLEVDPGSTTSVVVDVVNTGDVIDGVTANVIGLADECVSTQPQLLPLFPATTGQLTVSLAVPPSHPAGRHPLTVELVSHGAHAPAQYLDVDLAVSARPELTVTPVPRVVRSRRSGRFVLEVANRGNIPLDVSLQAVDVDRSTKASFAPQQLRVPAGSVTPVLVHVRGPRMFTGSEVDRAVQVVASAVRADLPPDADPTAGSAIEPKSAAVRLRQRPLVSRGLLTALILLGILALWAGVFLLGLTKVFSNDPMTKAAPASFFAATQAGAANAAGAVAAQAAAGTDAANSAGTPAGAVPKSGQLPAGVGGEITGVVSAASTQQPAGRILVQAYRKTRTGLAKVSSAATQSDGSYTLAGLFPTSYYLQFSATGFRSVWYPDASGRGGARPVTAVAQGSTSGVNAVIAGLPASISGAIDPGDTLQAVHTTVTARPLNVAAGGRVKSAVTGAGGSYRITGLAAPASYQLTFTTPGYQASTLVDTVNGGDTRLEATVTLGASEGGITGIVVSGNAPTDPPLGGATVSTTVGGKTLSVMTPTTGAVGTFALPNLPTPATYVLSYSAPQHGTWTEVVELAAGQSFTKAIGKLSAGSGSLSGRLVDAQGAGLGGATVTVGGAANAAPSGGTGGASASPGPPAPSAPTTTTLTSPPVGRFFLNGLADGQYTLTFTLDGYAPASVTVQIDSGKAPPTVRVRLDRQLGAITGVISAGGAGLPGATVTATDGLHVFTATSSAAGGQLPAGGYLVADLPPGMYSVTATAPGHGQRTRLVRVAAGVTQRGQNLGLGG